MARDFFRTNQSLAKPHRLGTGDWGVKITTKDRFGIYTKDGQIVSFGKR